MATIVLVETVTDTIVEVHEAPANIVQVVSTAAPTLTLSAPPALTVSSVAQSVTNVVAAPALETVAKDIQIVEVIAAGPQGPPGTGGGGGGNYTVSETAPSNPLVGDRWLASLVGVEFTYVFDGNSYAWYEIGSGGLPGPTGPAGADGAAGGQGPAGPTGATGATGATGPAGADGAQGPAGPAGATGATGPTGPAGADGAQGPIGPTGPAGTNGTNGTNGVDGAIGPTGPAGATGPTGPAGSGGGTWVATTITVPGTLGGRREHRETIAAVGVTSGDMINVRLAPTLDTDENDPELIDLGTLVAYPGTDQFDVLATFSTLHSGAIKLLYEVI